MNATLVWPRILWKETRHLGPLAIAIVAICTGMSVLAGAAAANGGTTTQLLWGLAMFVPGCYGFGATAMLLSGEKEMGTWDWLRNSGVPQSQTLLAKAAFVVSSAYAVQIVLFAFALISESLHPSSPLSTMADYRIPFGLLVTLEFATIGWLACVLVSRIIPATVLWLGLLMLGALILSVLATPDGSIQGPQRIVVAFLLTCLLALDVLVSVCWWRCEHPLLELPGRIQTAWRRLSVRVLPSTARFEVQWSDWWQKLFGRRVAVLARPERSVFADQRAGQRLSWKTRRQMLRILGLVVGGLVVSFFIAIIFDGAVVDRFRRNDRFSAPWGMCAFPFFIGLLVFRDEQLQARFRFYADRGLSPRSLWWTAQRYWLPVILLVSLLIPVTFVTRFPRNIPVDFRWHVYFSLFGMLCVSYGVGQWASLVFRTTFFALIGGVLLLIPCVAWCGLSLYLSVPVWLQAIPLTLWLLVVTWWRMPAWSLEDSGWHSRGKLLLAMVVPPAVLFLVTCGYRAVEFLTPGYLTDSPSVLAAAPDFAAPLDTFSKRFDDLIADADAVNRNTGASTIEQQDELAVRYQNLTDRFYRDLLPGILGKETSRPISRIVLRRLPGSLLQLLEYDVDRRLRIGEQPLVALQNRIELLEAIRRLALLTSGSSNPQLFRLQFTWLLRGLPENLDSPQISAERARAALDAAARSLAEYPEPSDGDADYFRQRWELRHPDPEQSADPVADWISRVARRLPSERMRAECFLYWEFMGSKLYGSRADVLAGSFHAAAKRFDSVSYDEFLKYEQQEQYRRTSVPALWNISSPSTHSFFRSVEFLDDSRGWLLSAASVLFRKDHGRLPLDLAELTRFWKPDPRLELEPGLDQPFEYFRQGLGLGKPAWTTELDKSQKPWAQQPLWYVETRDSRKNADDAARHPEWYKSSSRIYGQFFPIPPRVEPDEPPANAEQVENPAPPDFALPGGMAPLDAE